MHSLQERSSWTSCPAGRWRLSPLFLVFYTEAYYEGNLCCALAITEGMTFLEVMLFEVGPDFGSALAFPLRIEFQDRSFNDTYFDEKRWDGLCSKFCLLVEKKISILFVTSLHHTQAVVFRFRRRGACVNGPTITLLPGAELFVCTEDSANARQLRKTKIVFAGETLQKESDEIIDHEWAHDECLGTH